MKLYYSPGACSLATHIVASEAGLHPEMVKVDLAAHKLEDGKDYYAINSRGYVPALDIGEKDPLTEVSVIVQYLADKKPESGLLPPAGTMARTRVQQWLAFISTELHKGFGPLFNPKTPDETKQIAVDKLKTRLGEIDKRLASSPFLAGDKFTVADAYAFTIINWTNFVKLDTSAWPHIADFMKRVAARPGVGRALKAEGLA